MGGRATVRVGVTVWMVDGCMDEWMDQPTDRGLTHHPFINHKHTAAMEETEAEAEAASKKGKGKGGKAAARESVDGAAGGKERSFQEIVSGKEQYEVCRLFLASLQLVGERVCMGDGSMDGSMWRWLAIALRRTQSLFRLIHSTGEQRQRAAGARGGPAGQGRALLQAQPPLGPAHARALHR